MALKSILLSSTYLASMHYPREILLQDQLKYHIKGMEKGFLKAIHLDREATSRSDTLPSRHNPNKSKL